MVAALSAAMTGCGTSDPDWTKVCVDSGSGRRVADRDCDAGGGGTGGGGVYGWRYYGSGGNVPGVGESASGGSTSAPRGASVGRAAMRGGFGGHGAGHGSVGG